ncbi:MAG: sulfatase family protein, partial [Bryobacteraceae bacterium]
PMQDRRLFLRQAGAALAAPVFAQPARRRRNILLLIGDDLGLHTGAYGDKIARTPNLDKMAQDGVLFSNAFCTTASCSASRSVILSGLHNHANGQYGHAHAEHHFAYLDFVRPIPALLKDRGYKTGVIGKLHVNPVDRFKWDLDSQGNNRDVLSMAGRARDFVKAAGASPWYLHVGYADPHRASKGFANRDYKGVERNREAANRLDQGVGMMFDMLRETGLLDNTLVIFMSDNGMPFPNAKTNLYEGGIHLPLIVRSPDQKKRGLVNNAMIHWTDICPTALDWAGAALPEYPLHGRSFLPILEQENAADWDQVYLSHTFHEITMSYPIRGVRTRRYKYLRNLFPELEFPHASDLWASATWQSVIRQGETAALGGRTAAKYLHRSAEELYDLEADPGELNNLALNAGHRQTLHKLRAQVNDFRKRTKDPWLINDNYTSPFEQ